MKVFYTIMRLGRECRMLELYAVDIHRLLTTKVIDIKMQILTSNILYTQNLDTLLRMLLIFRSQALNVSCCR